MFGWSHAKTDQRGPTSCNATRVGHSAMAHVLDGKTAVGAWEGANILSIAQFGKESAQYVTHTHNVLTS